MPANVWSLSNRATGGTAATATQNHPASASSAGTVVRLLSMQGTLIAGASAATDTVQVLDGATVIWQCDVSAAANTTAYTPQLMFDLRASIGNNLTVKFVNGAGTAEDINAQGDFPSAGTPYWGTTS